MNHRFPDRPRVLIVEHDEDLARLVERTLCGEGFHVSHASTSNQALELLAHEVFELVLLELALPEVNGLEICRRIKANPATMDTPIMFMAGEVRADESLAQALAAGGCDYLTKPFCRVDVVARVRCILHQRIELLRSKQQDMNDKLTGLPVRRCFLGRLDEELAEGARFSDPVSIILADVSDLATVHEQQGPQAGDRWVERFALLLRSECRRYDVVGRIDEFRFGVLLPRVSAAGALKAARRMSETWRLTTLEVGGLDFYVPAFMAVESHQGSMTAPSGGDLLNRAATSLERARRDQSLAADGVIGPTPDPYAASIWSDYLAPAPLSREP